MKPTLPEYGEIGVCSFHPGWFSETLAGRPVPYPVRMVYIDCDVAGPTKEVLSGVIPMLAKDGVVYTQDYHLPDVKELLRAPGTWSDLGVPVPEVKHIVRNLARISWDRRQ